ncbi:MAG: 2,3-dihydro-2,3-dihydroxybenzoate dehydrogenase [Pseudomonadota bacterium]|nr:2,3-dihydro-2,3-dihydroxybenzoate dehydrogenase [Pseudomonadota bacterium]
MSNSPVESTTQVVMISGAARGIGAAVARTFAALGHPLALLDCQPDVTQLARALAATYSVKTLGLILDVSDRSTVEQAVTRVEDELGELHTLVNVAGILRLGSLLEMAAEDWDRTQAVNSTGVFNLSTSVARRLVTRRRGCIITVGSNAATTARTQMGAYAASKAASHQFTRCLGLELAPYGIRCNIVSPGSTDTDMQRQLWTSDEVPAGVLQGSPEQFRLGIPLQRIASPEDIANAVRFLASDEARHITLHDLRVDGGATLDA